MCALLYLKLADWFISMCCCSCCTWILKGFVAKLSTQLGPVKWLLCVGWNNLQSGIQCDCNVSVVLSLFFDAVVTLLNKLVISTCSAFIMCRKLSLMGLVGDLSSDLGGLTELTALWVWKFLYVPALCFQLIMNWTAETQSISKIRHKICFFYDISLSWCF